MSAELLAPFAARGDLVQDCAWPGIVAVQSLAYTCVHGISPNLATLVSLPQPDPVTGDPKAPYVGQSGDLYLSDGTRSFALRDARVVKLTGRRDAGGVTYTLLIADRRWRWQSNVTGDGFGAISGHYNVPDRRGKLVPWTIRSPTELAQLCLQAMGEREYVLDMPPGLPRVAGADLDRYLRLGENFAVSGTNPEVYWDHTPPAQALARLCDLFNRRVCFQPVANRVAVQPVGAGPGLPGTLPAELDAPSVTAPEAPSAIGVYGGPIRFQKAFLLRAVARDWQGEYVPKDEASYAPLATEARTQETQVSYVGDSNPLTVPGLRVSIFWTDSITGASRSTGAQSTDPVASVAARLDDLGNKFNDIAALAGTFAVYNGGSGEGRVLGIDGRVPGMSFTVATTSFIGGEPAATVHYSATTVQAAQKEGYSWDTCPPELFPSVRPTDRLSYQEAVSLAKECVHRVYRIVNEEPFGGGPLVFPPTNQKLTRVQQVKLNATKVSQIVPEGRVAGSRNANDPLPGNPNKIPGQGVLPEFYNGYSRDRKATVHGSVSKFLANGTRIWISYADPNTGTLEKVPVNFDVVEGENGDQLVVFESPVYRWEQVRDTTGIAATYYREPRLVLETSCHLLDAVTSAVARYERVTQLLGGTGPVEWHEHPDLQVGIVASDLTGGRQAQIGTSTITWTGAASASYRLTVNLTWAKNNQAYTATLSASTAGGMPIAQRWANLQGSATGNTDVARDFALSFDGAVFTFTGKSGFAFTVRATATADDIESPPDDLATAYRVDVVQAGSEATTGLKNGEWHYAPGDLAYATAAADYYTAQHAMKYLLSTGRTMQFVGTHPIDPNGRIVEVEWTLGAGATTVASENTERGRTISPYPARRRAENLPPAAAAVAANMAERAAVDRLPRLKGVPGK